MRDRPSVAAGVHPVPGTRVFIEHPGSDPQLVVFTTWDDMAPSCSEQISDEQRATVHRLQRQGFGISYAWPDFDYPDLDHIVVHMVRLLPRGRAREVYILRDGSIHGPADDLRIVSAPVTKRPPAPENHRIDGPDASYLVQFADDQDALACLRFAAAVNGGPPSWITRYLAPDVVVEAEWHYTLEGPEQAMPLLEEVIDWKLNDKRGGNRACAEVGVFPSERRPGVALLFFERARRGWKASVRRSVWQFFTEGTPFIRRIEVAYSSAELSALHLTGHRPALANPLPAEKKRQ